MDTINSALAFVRTSRWAIRKKVHQPAWTFLWWLKTPLLLLMAVSKDVIDRYIDDFRWEKVLVVMLVRAITHILWVSQRCRTAGGTGGGEIGSEAIRTNANINENENTVQAYDVKQKHGQTKRLHVSCWTPMIDQTELFFKLNALIRMLTTNGHPTGQITL